MTKLEKGLCTSPGCHEKAHVELVVILPERHLPHLYCHSHFLQWLTYMVSFFSENREWKEDLKKGLDLYSNKD